MQLFVFNPEHDYALANGNAHFVAPQSAIQFANDCATLPLLFAQDKPIIWRPYHVAMPFLTATQQKFTGRLTDVTEVVPWGWDNALINKLLNLGIRREILPDRETMDTLRNIAHRKTSIEAMRFLRQHYHNPETLPQPAMLLTNLADIEHFVESYPAAILKSPFSGNGRGNLPTYGHLTPTLRRQCNGVLLKQGALLGEPQYNVIQEFAMEFSCHGGNTQFEGLSLFKTRHFGYLHNLLLSDYSIQHTLSQWISPSVLDQTQQLLMDFIHQNITPFYNGYLGVDMFIYEKDNQYKLNPVVEINLRMTMGMVAHIIFEKLIDIHVTGLFQVTYFPVKGQLLHYATAMKQKYPLKVKDNRWISGFANLTPIDENTQYSLTVSL